MSCPYCATLTPRSTSFSMLAPSTSFNGKERAIREMIRVAKPGMKIVMVDETERVVKSMYEKMPIVRWYYRGVPRR